MNLIIISLPLAYTVLVILLVIIIYKRTNYNREAYSRTTILAFFNIVTLGYFFGFLSLAVVSTVLIPISTLTILFAQIHVTILLYGPITLFLLIVAWGKKIEEVENTDIVIMGED